MTPKPSTENVELVEKAIQFALRLCITDDGIPFPYALTMVLDKYSADRNGARFLNGEISFSRACALIGSTARVAWAVDMLSKKKVDRDLFMQEFPTLWETSDPDGTDPRFLKVWKQVYMYHKRKTVVTGDPISTGAFIVYRGQASQEDLGCDWTRDERIAQMDALATRGGPRKQPGVIVMGMVSTKNVYAYLTSTARKTVITDPSLVQVLPPHIQPHPSTERKHAL